MLSVTVASLLATFLVGCTPRVEVAVPEKPITINLNVKVEHEIKVKIDKELDEIFSEDSELF
ncbi:YnbE family lipoprotein [Zooshikella sp. WH53]|uniref:YnbE family lipoprotein n=2 Tax=Zooshikella harenae TaxID=2827238 RepID=A0ABS5ZE65_9GAMM|nr:YnbE family lipoprotein [Zooshikella harenae]MBU2712358.1 YnbE family lipoprotein [Zooshikella harenae]